MFHRPVVMLTALLAAGCGHAMSAPMPDVKGTISIRVVNEEMPFPQLLVVVLPDVSDDSQIVGVSILDKKSMFMIRSVSQ